MRTTVGVISKPLVFLLAIGACANNVRQDKATTPDGKIAGAKPLTLVNGAVTDTGIVTYPGGDRIDWKVVELPTKKQGTLEVQLSWVTPRPGLQLAFDVYDQWNASAASSSKGTKKKSGRTRLAAIEDASGKYFVRVYAVGRGDAGRYKLDLTFKETTDKTKIPWLDIQVTDPPRLAELPGVEVPCDTANPTPIKACRGECWPGAPANWPGCAKTCTSVPPNPNIPICAATAECPATPDRRFARCTLDKFGPCKDPAHPDADNPRCDNVTVPPLYGVFTTRSAVADKTFEVDFDVLGTVDKATWTATMLRGGDRSNQPATDTVFAGPKVTIVDVEKRGTASHIKVRITDVSGDQLTANRWIKLTPPPRKKP
ncbi:MAG: hypothetical protein ABI867_13700 [Kofleriaceae bacterium]